MRKQVLRACALLLKDRDLLFEQGLKYPMTLLRESRLQLLVRVASEAPPALMELVQNLVALEGGWVKALKDDLSWLSAGPRFPDLGITSVGDLSGVLALMVMGSCST